MGETEHNRAQRWGSNCPIQDELEQNLDVRCERGCSCRVLWADLLIVSLGFGAFYNCFPGGAAGIGWLVFCDGAWPLVLLHQMLALASTALGALVFKRLLWEDGSFPHVWVRRMAYGTMLACQLVAYAVQPTSPSPIVGCLLAFVSGVAMSYPLLAWFEALQMIYRRAGREHCIVALMLSFAVAVALGLIVYAIGAERSWLAIVAMVVVSEACHEVSQLPTSRFATNGAHGKRDAYRLSRVAIPVLISFGTTWSLACCLVVESVVSSDDPACVLVRLVGGLGVCAAVLLAVRMGVGRSMHFGFIIRATVVAAGIMWVLVPVFIKLTPYTIGFTGTVVFIMTGASMTFFSIEIARETGLSIPSVMPVNYVVFVIAGCCAAACYALVRSFVPEVMSWSVIAALAVIAALVATPTLPSNVSDATMFTLKELPENEGYSERVERVRTNFSAKYGLTEREAEVFDLLVQGMTREQIADGLSISAWTVKDHIGKIYAKAGVHSAKELMRLVAGAGK